MSRWVKLHAKISESYDFAEVHAEDKNAALLFLLALPQADVFGVLPGHSAILKGKLCSMLDITEEQVSNAFNVLVSHKLLIEYTDSNHRRLYIIPKYSAYQDTRWGRISTPEYELPEGWEPPAELLASIEKYPESDIAKWWQSRQKKNDKTQCAGLLPDYSRTTPGLLPDKSRPETETETETESDNDSLSPSEHPDVAAEDLQLQTEPKKKPAKRVKPPIEETIAAIEALRLEYSQEDLQQVDDFIGMVREHRKGGRLAASVIKKMIEGLLKLRREPGMTSDAFAYGITQAILNNVDNVNYAAKASRNYNPQQALPGNRTPPQKLGGFGIPTSMEEMLKQVGKQKL